MKKVSVICIDCEPDYIDQALSGQTYEHLEVVEAATGKDFYQDIVEYCGTTDSDYICFLEQNQRIAPDKIQKMVEYAEKYITATVLFCNRNYIEKDGTIVAHPDKGYEGQLKDKLFLANQILEICFTNGRNLMGNLTTTMFCRKKVILNLENLKQYEVEGNPSMQKAFLLFEILVNQLMVVQEEALVDTYVDFCVEKANMKKMGDSFVESPNLETLKAQEALFESLVETFVRLHGWKPFEDGVTGIPIEQKEMLQGKKVEIPPVKKEITFFAQNKGEYYNLLPIMDYARERGYQVKHTDDLREKAEIGVYCQHFGRPENSKFSVVLLHDMAQGHNRWPNIWELERWSAYDIGIVPGEEWRDRWERCAFQYYANPRCGAYMFGYPKSHEIYSEEMKKRAEELKKEMNLKYEMSVLYAPSWECWEKEDDFVRALASLPVNLLVKQAPWAKGYGDTITNNVKNMRELHEGKYDNLHYFEWDENILVCLMMSDLLVSDESSVMMEALLFGVPSIGVQDWMVPDTTPPRFACIPFKNVYKCKKVELREKVEKLIAIGPQNAEVIKKSQGFFVNKENVNKDILDAIEYFTTGAGSQDFMKWKMTSRYMPTNLWS